MEITWLLLSGLIPLKVLIWHWVGHFYSLWHKWSWKPAIYIRWSGLRTGLDSDKVVFIISGDWNDTGNIELPLTEYASFYLQHSCHFGANLHIIVLYNSWFTVEERTALIIADKHSYTRWCNQFWERCGFLSYFYAATKFDLGDVIILLTLWIWILIPRLIIHSLSGNNTNVNVHVGFSRWGVTVYCSKSVYGSACLHWVLPLDSGQCLFGLHQCR